MLPKHILVPTDFSEGAEEALDYACELARTFGATVHLMHVIGIPALGVPELGAIAQSGEGLLVVALDVSLHRIAELRSIRLLREGYRRRQQCQTRDGCQACSAAHAVTS